MLYSPLIRKSIDRAFKAAGDLAVEVVFTRKVNTTFDFGNLAVISDKPLTSTAKVLWGKRIKTPKEPGVIKRTLLVPTASIGDLNAFDKIDDSGEIWKIGMPITDTGFITLLEVYKEI